MIMFLKQNRTFKHDMLYNACLLAKYHCYIEKDYDILWYVLSQNFRSDFLFCSFKNTRLKNTVIKIHKCSLKN